jgi:hypothetical protein
VAFGLTRLGQTRANQRVVCLLISQLSLLPTIPRHRPEIPLPPLTFTRLQTPRRCVAPLPAGLQGELLVPTTTESTSPPGIMLLVPPPLPLVWPVPIPHLHFARLGPHPLPPTPGASRSIHNTLTLIITLPRFPHSLISNPQHFQVCISAMMLLLLLRTPRSPVRTHPSPTWGTMLGNL